VLKVAFFFNYDDFSENFRALKLQTNCSIATTVILFINCRFYW